MKTHTQTHPPTMSEILLFSRLMSSLVSARTFWLSSWRQIPSHINKHVILEHLCLWNIFHNHFLTSSLLLSCSSSRFIFYMRSNTGGSAWKLCLNGKKNNQIKRDFKTATMFSDRRLANSVFSRITMSFLMESRWAMSCWTAISLQRQLACVWACCSSQCVGTLDEKAEYLVGFGDHVFINNIHVGCGQCNQSRNDQLCLTLRETCEKEKLFE